MFDEMVFDLSLIFLFFIFTGKLTYSCLPLIASDFTPHQPSQPHHYGRHRHFDNLARGGVVQISRDLTAMAEAHFQPVFCIFIILLSSRVLLDRLF